MKHAVPFELDGFTKLFPDAAARTLAAFVEAMVTLDLEYLRLFPSTPTIYLAGIRYEDTPAWRDIPALLRHKTGDCKSIVAWRLAELRAKKENATLRVIYQGYDDEDHYHLCVRRASSEVEDPSVRLGMRAHGLEPRV